MFVIIKNSTKYPVDYILHMYIYYRYLNIYLKEFCYISLCIINYSRRIKLIVYVCNLKYKLF